MQVALTIQSLGPTKLSRHGLSVETKLAHFGNPRPGEFRLVTFLASMQPVFPL